MGSKRAAMFRFAAQVALVLLVVSGTSDSQLTFDDNVIDDLGVDALGSPDTDGMLVHEDSEHMSKADVKQASEVYDTLFPTEEDGDLGESDSIGEENPLETARAARKQATKTLLAATGEDATRKAEAAVESAKMSSLGKGEYQKQQKAKVERELAK